MPVNVPTIDHRSASFGTMFKPLFAGVKEVLKTKDGEVIIFPATGTAGWEAAISNTLSPGDKVLACRHGMFSHRWIDMCQRHGLDVHQLNAPWGAGAPAAEFQAALEADKDHEIKAVLVTHNETATGVRSDVAAVRKAMDAAKHPALLLVDGVSSIGCMDFRMDEWGVDVAVTGSQKGFMLPDRPRHRRRQPEGARGDGDGEAAALLPRLPRHAEHQPQGRLSLHPAGQPASTASASR